jgi:hypothetical protein
VGPGVCVHPAAEAKLLNAVKDGGGVDSWAAERIIPARKGAVLGECLEIAAATDSDPADWPYNFMKISEKSSRGGGTHHDRYLFGIATELGNILFDPLER